MSKQLHGKPQRTIAWIRIPDGIKVRHRYDGHDGFIDGLTEFVVGPNRNPDGQTQYRLNTGVPLRQLVTEDDLCMLLDSENLVIMAREKVPYRRHITERLHGVLTEDRFIQAGLTMRRKAG
jgi:hypothetical protein